jgi:hypothetical protein
VPVPPVGAPPNVDPETLPYPEVVYLIMDGKDGWTWFCTAALISSTVAVTAAHCLQSDLFLAWHVKAPTIAGTPTVDVTKVTMYDSAWDQRNTPTSESSNSRRPSSSRSTPFSRT